MNEGDAQDLILHIGKTEIWIDLDSVANTGKVKHCWRTMMEESYIIKVCNIS